MSVPGRGNSQCKGPAAGTSLVCEAVDVAGARVREGSGRWGQCVDSRVVCVHALGGCLCDVCRMRRGEAAERGTTWSLNSVSFPEPDSGLSSQWNQKASAMSPFPGSFAWPSAVCAMAWPRPATSPGQWGRARGRDIRWLAGHPVSGGVENSLEHSGNLSDWKLREKIKDFLLEMKGPNGRGWDVLGGCFSGSVMEEGKWTTSWERKDPSHTPPPA